MSNIVSIINGEALTTSLAIAEGVGRPHKNILELVRANLEDFQCFGPVAFETRKGAALPQGGFAKATEYALLNEHQATLLITFLRNIGAVKEFKKRLVKAFFEMRDELGKTNIQVPQSLPEALRLAAVAIEERDKALQTKAEIGSRREATAMATASREARRAKKLEDQLGISTNWKQVKAIGWLGEVFDLNRVAYQQIGKKLKAVSLELDLPPMEIEDEQYGNVKAYHIDAIALFRKRLEQDAGLLSKYRAKQAA